MEVDHESAKGYLAHEHYYGREVRGFFIVSALIMLVTLPVFNSLIPMGAFFSLLMVVVIGLLAGLLSPLSKVSIIAGTIVAMVGGIVFEYEAISTFWIIDSPIRWWFFAVNQLLAVLFFFALYYSGKTLRGVFLTGMVTK